MAITNEILNDCRRRFAAGEPDENVIAHLRNCGLSKAETIKVYVDLNRASPDAAKRLVHLSAAWRDAYQRDERLHDLAEEMARNESRRKSEDQ